MKSLMCTAYAAMLVLICALSTVAADRSPTVSVPTESAYMPAPVTAHVKLLAEPPEVTPEMIATREKAVARMIHTPEPWVPDAGVPYRGIAADPSTQTIPDAPPPGVPPSGAPGAFVFFENTDLGTAGAPLSERSYVNEPSCANNGRLVFYSGNWYAALSRDGGKTFSYINPYTAFPPPAGMGFCCDQSVLYDPDFDCMFWLLQYTADGNTNNIERLAVCNNFGALETQQWYYYDFSPQQIGATDGHWFDFPDLVLGQSNLYLTANYIGPASHAAILRLPLGPLSTGSGFGFSYITQPWPNQWVFRCTHGASTTMFFASHVDTNTVRIYRWRESGGADYVDRNVTPWYNAFRTATGADGRRWLNHFPSAGGYILGAWAAKGTIGFMWCSSQGGSYPMPYVAAARFQQSDRSLINEPLIWSGTVAWAFPSVNVNGRGDIAGSVMYCPTNSYPSCSVFIWDDLSIVPPGWENHASAIGTSGPATDRSGDYLTTRVCFPYDNTWVGTAFTLQGGPNNSNAVPRFLWYGRERDRPFIALMNDTPEYLASVPQDFSFEVKSYDWAGIAIYPRTNLNLRADDDFRFDTPYQYSTYTGTTRDFIVANGHRYGSVTHYAQIPSGGITPYSIEAEWEAYDLALNNVYTGSMSVSEVIDMYEVRLNGGQQYVAVLNNYLGSADLSMTGFDGSRWNGRRADREWLANSSGAGGSESHAFTALSTDYYAIAVINENAGRSDYSVQVYIPEPLGGIAAVIALLYAARRR